MDDRNGRINMSGKIESAELGIEAAAQRSGLSQHLIRIWERRYGAVKPVRTESNRRLYTEADVVRLALLNRAVHAGHRISDIAGITTPKLERLVETSQPFRSPLSATSADASNYVERAVEAILRFDAESLEALLSRSDVDLGQVRSLELVVMPLMERIGTMWNKGDMRVAHEHAATAVVTHHVGSILASFRYESTAPVIVAATPLGQMHEAGALAVAVVAAVQGWRPLYVGPSLPAEEIAGVAQKSGARAVALSLVFPSDDPRLPAELNRLRQLLSDDVPMLIGGRAAEAYGSIFDSANAVRIRDLDEFRHHLNLLRSGKVTH